MSSLTNKIILVLILFIFLMTSVFSIDNSITTIQADSLNDGTVEVNITCETKTSADLNIYTKEGEKLTSTPTKIDCNTSNSKSIITISSELKNNELIMLQASISKYSSCTSCAKQLFLNYELPQKPNNIPDNNLILVLVSLLVVVLIVQRSLVD